MATWHNEESARDEWSDAPLNEDTLTQLLAIAKDAVLAYAPALPTTGLEVVDGIVTDPEPVTIPDSYRFVQLAHARNVYRSLNGDSNAQIGLDDFAVPARMRNLDAALRELLRPRTVFGGAIG